MERDDTTGISRDLDNAGDGLPEEWCILDEWSDHSESELEEGEIVDSDTDCDTNGDTNNTVTHGQVPGRAGMSQAPRATVEPICRKTPRNLLKMAEVAVFSGSEDGEIVEAENPLNCKLASDKITNENSVGRSLTDGSPGTMASSDFRERKQLSAVIDSGNGSLSSKGKLNGDKSFPENQKDSTVQGNELNLVVDATGDVHPVEAAAQGIVSVDSVTSKTLDVHTRGSTADETSVLREREVTEDSLVQNGCVAMSPVNRAEESATNHDNPSKLPETDFSSLEAEFDTDMTEVIAAGDTSAIDEIMDNDNVTVGNTDFINCVMVEDDKELSVESMECVHQPKTSKDKEHVDPDEVVPVSSNMVSVTPSAAEPSTNVMSPAKTASTETLDKCSDSTGDGARSDVQNVGPEMESTATHVKNNDNLMEEPLGLDGQTNFVQNEASTNYSGNTTEQQETMEQCSKTSSTLDAELATTVNEMIGEDKTVTTEDAGLPVKGRSVTVGNKGLLEINKDLIAAIEDLADEDKELETRETADPQEESSDKGLVIHTNQTTDPNKEIPTDVISSCAVMESTVTSPRESSPSEVDVTSSKPSVVPASPDVVEVSVLPSKDTQGATESHKETCVSAADEDVDVITVDAERIHPDTTGKQTSAVGATEPHTGIVTEADLNNQLIGGAPQSQATVSTRIPADSQRTTKVSPESSSTVSSGTGPELLQRHANLDTARSGVSLVSSRLLCDFCPMVFDDESQLILHLESHEKVCCATQVASTFEYSRHMYQCVACSFSTRSRMVFREHIRSHIVKFPYWCGTCHAVSESIDSLQRHSLMVHPDTPCRLIPRHCITLEQILRKLGPAAPSTVTRLQNTDGTPVNATVLPPSGDLSAAVARPQSGTKEQYPDAKQVNVVDDVDEEVENQNGDSADSLCHLKISSVVSLSDSAKAVENFSGKDDSSHSTGKDSLAVPVMSDCPTRPSKSAVLLECFYSNGLYHCKLCKYETPNRRYFRCHIVREVHEKSNVCRDCHMVPMSILLSESHHCPVVEKVLKAVRKGNLGQTSRGSVASVSNQIHPGRILNVRGTNAQPSPGISDDGYVLPIHDTGSVEASVQGGNTGASGLRHTTSGDNSLAQVSHVRISPVASVAQLYLLKHGSRAFVISEDPKSPNPVAVLPSPVVSRSSVHNEVPVSRPSDVVITPAPEIISPIVIQPINTGQLAGIPSTLGYSPATTAGMENRATFSTACDGEMLHLSRTHSPASGELCRSGNNLGGCTGSWSTESTIPSLSVRAESFTPGDHQGGLDSSFTEAFSMLEELGNAQAGLCAPPQPQLNASADVSIIPSPQSQALASGDRSEMARQSEVIVVLDTPTELTPGGDAVPQVIENATMQPQRTDVIADTRLASTQQVVHLHKSVSERPADTERTENDRYAYYRCGFSSCSFLGDSETGFCNHYYNCHRDVYIYRCAFCPSMFRYSPQLCEHLRHCHHQVRYRCLSCREPFHTQRQLIVHMIQNHRLSTSIRCASSSGCTISTNSLSQFRTHYEASHFAESCFTCSCCSMEFSEMAPLMRHIEKSINRFVSCPVCKRMSTAVACKKLLHHIITEHPDAPRTIVKMNFINCWEKLSLNSSVGTVASGTAMQIFMPDIMTGSKGSANQSNTVVGKGAQGSREGTPVAHHPREIVSVPAKAMKLKQTARKTQATVPHSVLRNELMGAEQPEIMLTCDHCNFACTIPVLLDQHQRLHDRVVAVPSGTLFKCSRCPFFTNSINEFKTHTRYHLGPQMVLRYFRCTVCSRYATSDMNLIEEHMERKHPESSCSYKVSREVLTHPNTTVLCLHCGATCLGEASLAKHMQQRHSSLADPPKEKSSRRSSMIGRPPRESSTVSIEKYHCDLCEFDTNSMALMKQHHASEHMSKTTEHPPAVVIKQEPVLVENLPSSETDAASTVGLDNGVLQKSRSTALLTCDHCPYNTHVLHHMERHRKSHDEQMQITEGFRCGYCLYVSTQKYTMTRHVRRYHANEPMNLKLVSGGVVTALPSMMDLTNDEQSSCVEKTNAVIVGTVKQVQQLAPTMGDQSSKEHPGSDSSVMSISEGEDLPSLRSFSCNICSYKASSRNHYLRHQRNHTNSCEDGYRCTYCGYMSVIKGPVTKHVAQQHPGLPLKITHFLGSSKPRLSSSTKVASTKKHLDEVTASAVQETMKVSSSVCDDSSAINSEPTTSVMTEPGSIAAFELSLPKEMIFKMAVDCPLCDYSTKVHYNMVRHLQGHCNTLNSVAKAKAGQLKATNPPGEVKVTDSAGEVKVTDPPGEVKMTDPVGEVKVTDPAGEVNVTHPADHVTSDAVSSEGMRHSVSSEVILTQADEESDKPSEAEKQTGTTSCADSSSEEEDDSDYVVEEGDETSKGVQDSAQYCTRVQNMDLYRCTKCVFMHRFPSKVRRHYFYKHAKCYPYKCGHCTFEAVESGKIKRHCILMHDLLPIKVIKRQVDSTNDSTTLSEGVIMSDVRHENVDVIADSDDDTDDTWLGAYITKTSIDNHQQCRICGYVQLGASSVKRHVLAVHLKFYPYSCRYCSYSQVEINKVKKHIEHSHPGRPCSIVKRKLGVPSGEGDDSVMQDGDVIERNDNDVSTQVSGGSSPQDVTDLGETDDKDTGRDGDNVGKGKSEGSVAEGRGDITRDDSVEPSSDEVNDQPGHTTPDTVEEDTAKEAQPPLDGPTASGLVAQSTGHNAENNSEINKSAVTDIDRQNPDIHTEETKGDDKSANEETVGIADETSRPGTDSATSDELIMTSKMLEQTVTPPGSREDTKEHDTVSIGGQTSIVDRSDITEQDTEEPVSDSGDLTTDRVLDETATESTGSGLVQGETTGVSDTNDNGEIKHHNVDTEDTTTRSSAESNVDIPTSARIEGSTELSLEAEMTSMKNRTGMADTSIGESVGGMSGSGNHLVEHQEVDDLTEEKEGEETMLTGVTSNDKVESLCSDNVGIGSLDDSKQREGSETMKGKTIEDTEEIVAVEQNSLVPFEQRGDVDLLSDEDIDGGTDIEEESEGIDGISEDTHNTLMEESSHVLSRDSTPAPHDGSSQVGQVDNVPADVGTVTSHTAGSSLPEMRVIKQELLDTTDGHTRNREEPILSVFANELAETAIKQEDPHDTDFTNPSFDTTLDADGIDRACLTNIRHVPYQSLLKQRKVFLCVYCEYRSLYSPSDVRKHIFAVHMRRYPYRCSYCAFQNMKKFNVQKHTKKAHGGRLVVVSEAPIFRNNITVLESQGNRVNVGVVGADGIPVLDVNLLAPLLQQLDDSPTKDIPGKKWTRKVSVSAPALHNSSSIPSSETEKESTIGGGGVPQWRCTECGMETEKISRVQIHVLTRHLKLRPYQCPYCLWGTWKTTPVEEHVRLKHPTETVKVLENIHGKLTEIKKYIAAIPEAPVERAAVSPIRVGGDLPTMHCDLCSYTASSQTRLQKHRKTHFCYRPFGCFHCEYTSFSRFKVRCHSSRVHKDKQVIVKTLKTPDMTDPRINNTPQTSPYKCVGAGVQVCGHCPYTASTSEKLDSHMKREHPELMSYKCGHCGIYLTSKEHMAEHVIERHAVTSGLTEGSSVSPEKRLKVDDCHSISEVTVKSEPGTEIATTTNKRPTDNNTGGAPTVPLKKLKLSDLLSTPKSVGFEPKGSSSPLSAGYLFRCKHCNFTSTLSLVMRHHVMAHLHYRPFCCPLCDTVRAVKSYPIKKHIAVYHQGGSVQCALQRDAEMENKVQASYTRETLSGTVMARCEKIGSMPPGDKQGLFVYKCNLCSYTSPTHKFMQHHVMGHLNYQPHRCPYCVAMKSVRSYPIKKHIECMHRGKKIEIAYTADLELEAKLAASFTKQRLDSSKETELLMSTTSSQKTLPVVPSCQKKVPVVSLVAVPQNKTLGECPEKKWQTVPNKASQGSSDQHQGSDKRPKCSAHTTYVCKWCGYMAATPSLVRLHAMIHFGYRPFSCPHCTTMKSVRSYPIKKHIRTMHPGKPIEVILKANPDIEAKVQQSYIQKDLTSKAPVSGASKDDRKKVAVERTTGDKAMIALKTERLLVKKSKKAGKFVCNTCSYASPNWTLIRRHVMVHVGYRPYHCPYCQTMRSVRGSPVRLHIRSMHPGKPTNVLFRPDMSADAKVLNGFSRLTKLATKPVAKKLSESAVSDNTIATVTMAVTTPSVTASPKRVYSVIFRCINCSFKTKYKADLRFHLMGEMGYRPFHCSYCDHKAVGRCLLRKHQRKHHTGKFSVSINLDPGCEATLLDLMERSIKNGIPAPPQPNLSTTGHPVVVKLEPNNAAGLAPMLPLGGATRDPTKKRYKRYNCTECSYSCSKKKLLQKHCLVRHDPKKYGCGYCTFKEFYPSHVRRHCRRQHRGLTPSCILLSTGEQVSFREYTERVTTTVTAATTPTPARSAVVAPAVKPKKEASPIDKSVVTDGIAPDNVTQLFNATLRKYECYLCLYSNSNVTLFKKHISVHYPARWQCGHCALKFRQMDRLRRHSRLAHPGVPIRCANDEPGYNATASESPTTIKTDPSPQSKPLTVPKIKVTARKSIHKIIPIVTEEKPLAVPKKKLTARKSISRFVPTLNETVLRFFCGLCPFAATSEDALSKHMLVVHSSGSGGAVRLKCGFCSFTTFDDAAFIEHAWSHALGNSSVHSDKQQAPQIDPNGKDMQPDVKLVNLLHLSQSELENLLVKNDIGGIYF